MNSSRPFVFFPGPLHLASAEDLLLALDSILAKEMIGGKKLIANLEETNLQQSSFVSYEDCHKDFINLVEKALV